MIWGIMEKKQTRIKHHPKKTVQAPVPDGQKATSIPRWSRDMSSENDAKQVIPPASTSITQPKNCGFNAQSSFFFFFTSFKINYSHRYAQLSNMWLLKEADTKHILAQVKEIVLTKWKCNTTPSHEYYNSARHKCTTN